jgi:hypothetical protein
MIYTNNNSTVVGCGSAATTQYGVDTLLIVKCVFALCASRLSVRDNRQKCSSSNHGRSNTLMHRRQTPVVRRHLVSVNILKYLKTKY